MSDITVSSREEFEERRRQLRWKRRWRLLKLFWRTVLVGSAAGGLVWFIGRSDWILRNPEQIAVEGMELLSEETVRSLIPIAYPELIIDIDPDAIVNHLKERGPIDSASVERQIFPPSLSIHITERRPVAVLLGDTYLNPLITSGNGLRELPTPHLNVPSKVAPTGLLDENGNWLPLTSFANISEDLDLPGLKVIGMQPSYRHAWQSLYKILSHSPVEVYEVDWQNPGNLIINTELGFIHCGAYQENTFEQQLNLLNRMRNLSEIAEPSTIAYIDLSSLESPTLQFNQTAPQYGETILQIPMPQIEESSETQKDDESLPQ